MIVLLVLTDGRDEVLAQTIESARTHLWGPVSRHVMHTDAGDEHRTHLVGTYPDWEVIGGQRRGFGGAIDRAWRYVAWGTQRYVFHLEDDFVFNRGIDLGAMAKVLDEHLHIAQLALRRQPWNDDEKQAGGIVEQWPGEYTDREQNGYRWLEHRLFWTTNPSLFRTSRCRLGWPSGKHSEGIYSRQVFENLEVVSAFWGARDSGEAVTHIGDARVGVGY